MREIFGSFSTKLGLRRILISGLLFVLLSAPFRLMMSLVPGVTEVRPANMLPPVFGMIWGPAGAWGTALANAISDILVSHSPFKVWFPGFLINFFFAYLPYKLWYSIDLGGGISHPNINRVTRIVKFVLVVLADSLITTVLLALLFEYLGFQGYGEGMALLFFNNFDFTVVLGIPVLLLLSNWNKVGFWIPKPIQEQIESQSDERGEENLTESRRLETLFDLCLGFIILFGLGYLFAAQAMSAVLQGRAEGGLIVVFLLLEVAYIFRPFGHYRTDERLTLKGMSIRSKVILGFLLLSVFFVLVTGVFTWVGNGGGTANRRQLWEYIFLVVGISLNILTIVSIIFLTYVERKITNPLEILTEQVDRFAKLDHQKGVDEDRQIARKLKEEIRTGDEIEGLSDSFRHMMSDIDDYVQNLTRVTAEKERIGAELNVATQIQADMLPRTFPPFPDRKEFDIYATMTPAKEVGGDFYDFFLADDDHLALVMADVSGKGVPAALFMVIAKTLIKNRTQMGGDLSPAAILTDVNEQLCEGNEAELFVTVWLAILSLSTGKGLAANAGHEHPTLRRAGGQYELVEYRHSPAVATMEGIRFREHEFEMHPGDSIYVYTDGVAEATDAREELFGTERMLKALNRDPGATPEVLLRTVKEEIDTFVGDAPQFDDITMLGLTWFGPGDCE